MLYILQLFPPTNCQFSGGLFAIHFFGGLPLLLCFKLISPSKIFYFYHTAPTFFNKVGILLSIPGSFTPQFRKLETGIPI